MKPFAPRLASYLGRHVLLATLATGAVLLGFVSVIDFVTELRDVGKESYTLSHAMLYVLLTMPTRSYEVFPTVAVIGSLLGLGGLAASSELTAMRAVGVSRLQVGLAALLPLFALPLARSEPRQPQYGLVLVALLVYVVGMLLLLLGTGLIGGARIPSWLGLWWVHLPMLLLATWMFRRDGRLPPVAQARA